MSPVALMLDLLLAALLVLALVVGWRLERRLKTLRDSHAGFVDAVADLDDAARRAEVGLASLRTATDEALDLLVGRIDKAREIAGQLERLTTEAAASPILAMERKYPRPPEARAPERRRTPDRLGAGQGLGAPQRVDAIAGFAEPPLDPEAAAEAMVEHLVLKLSRDDALPARAMPRVDGRVEGRLDARRAARARR